MNLFVISFFFFNLLFSEAETSSLKGKAIYCESTEDDSDSSWTYIFKNDKIYNTAESLRDGRDLVKGDFVYEKIFIDKEESKSLVRSQKCALYGSILCRYYLADAELILFYFEEKIKSKKLEDQLSRKKKNRLTSEKIESPKPLYYWDSLEWKEDTHVNCIASTSKEIKKKFKQRKKELKIKVKKINK